MLTLNHDIQDQLINDKAGEIVHVVLQNNAFKKLYIRFLDPQSSLKAMSKRSLSRQNSWVPIKNSEGEISMKTYVVFF